MKARTSQLQNFKVRLPGVPGEFHYQALSQEEAEQLARQDMGLEPKARRTETAPVARKHETPDQLFARRAKETAAYQGPGPGKDSSTGDKAEADFARRASQVEASKS